MKKNQSSSRGSSKLSRLRLTSKPNTRKSRNRLEPISKYFSNAEVDDIEGTSNSNNDIKCEGSESVESPYKDSVSQLAQRTNESLNDSNDFVSPIKTIAKIFDFKKCNGAKNKKSCKSKKRNNVRNPTIQILEDNFQNNGVNPDSLQMALALSKSEQNSYSLRPTKLETNLDLQSQDASSQLKIARINGTLEQFIFGTGKATVNRQTTSDVAFKKRKKSKFQYITPVLFMRTQEDREKIIATKVSMILGEQSENLESDKKLRNDVILHCLDLKRVHAEANDISKINRLDFDSLNDEKLFRTKSLNVSPTDVICGSLLKNWEDIPGRVSTPPPQNCIESSVNKLELLVNANDFVANRCESPDLFDSDGDVEVNNLNKSIDEQLELSLELINNFKRIGSCESMSCENSDGRQINESSRNNTKVSVSPRDSPVEFDESKRNQISKFSTSIVEVEKDFIVETLTTNRKSKDSSDLSDYEMYRSQNGVCHFESFYDADKTEDFYVQDEYIDLFSRNLCVDKKDGVSTFDEEQNHILKADAAGIVRNQSSYDSVDLTQSSDESSIEDRKSACDKHVAETNYTDSINKEGKRVSDNYKDNDANSQDTIICISDEELNYSSIYSTPPTKHKNFLCVTPERPEESNSSDCCIHDKKETLCYNDDISKLVTENVSQKVYCIESSPECTDFKSKSDNEEFFSEAQNYCEFVGSCIENNEIDTFSFTNVRIQHERVTSLKREESLLLKSPKQSRSDFHLNDSLRLIDSRYDPVPGTSKIQTISNFVQNSHKTPENKDTEGKSATPDDALIVKTNDVTPMPDYDEMDTPKVSKELDKYGVKCLKRQRGVQVLKYIYESTHPLIDENEGVSDGDGKVVKRRKKSDKKSCKSRKNLESECYELHAEKNRNTDSAEAARIDVNCDRTEAVETVKNLIGENEELIFERTQSKKIASCRVPLQIAFHNLVASQPELRENILLYEPLQLEVLYSMLKEQGYKYNIQDLLTFLDKKCITVRINRQQNKKKVKTFKSSK